MRYTFLCVKKESTFSEQLRASSLQEATLRWHEESASRPGPPLDWELAPPMPVDGLRNVWCFAGTDPEDQFFLCHIVATSEIPATVHRTPVLTEEEEPDFESVEIVPGRGFGPVLFGMTVDEAEAVLGPIVDSSLHDDGVERSLHVAYQDVGLHLFFEEEEGGEFRLYSIEVDEDCPSDLFGAPLFPKTRDEVDELLRRNLTAADLENVEEETDEDAGEIRFEVFNLGMSFSFDLSSEELTHAGWSVFFDENDEALWPEAATSSAP
jgi:hypothetical protein